jgi:hypothetical protein
VHLASQFHASDYACAKFGAGGERCFVSPNDGTLTLETGSAITYIPLSINLPDHFQQLKERQASYASTEAWWLCEPDSQRADSDAAPPELVPKLYPSDSVTFTQASPNLQHELRFAMDTPLIPSTWLTGESPLPKTSDTHPIGCVCLLPFPL